MIKVRARNTLWGLQEHIRKQLECNASTKQLTTIIKRKVDWLLDPPGDVVIDWDEKVKKEPKWRDIKPGKTYIGCDTDGCVMPAQKRNGTKKLCLECYNEEVN